MKKILLFSICCIALLSNCTGDKETFTLKGEIGKWNAPTQIYFSYWAGDEEHTDSTFLQNGKFSFTGKVNEPAPSRLILDYTGEGISRAARAGHILYLFLEAGTIKMKSPDSLQNSKFINSKINDEHLYYLDKIGGQIQNLADQMNKKLMQATEEERTAPGFMEGMNAEYRRLLNERGAKQQQYVRDHPNSYFSLPAISESVSSEFDVEEVEALFLLINEDLRQTESGKAFAQRIEAAKNISIGKTAPSFTQNNPEGNPISLSDFQGKYLLLEFWASWCGPCRQEAPFLVKTYNTYKDKGFEILGVSLDSKKQKDAWLEAIETDKLTWPQVSDLNSWNNAVARMYGIRAVPSNYLIDPQGIIIAKNLRGEELGEFLKHLFE
ncbi:MAG: AhpC/TSA family protein [Bacteroidales bacterium]|nr:AhpC/TSA family protein [Bacteroidales bacterium]